MRRVSTKALVITGLLVALLLAGVVSHYASPDPDGLNRVAEDKGFAATERDHGAADGPMAGYDVKGVTDDRLSGGLAGVAGSLVVLALAGGLTLVVRRRARSADTERERTAQQSGS
jgi:cobalt/nickel transport protein